MAALTLFGALIPEAAEAADPMCAASIYINGYVPAGDTVSVHFPGSYYVTSVSFNADGGHTTGILATGFQQSSPPGEYVYLYRADPYGGDISGWGQMIYKC
ncbi:hypothetical protein [Dactylosporangium sp. CA-092794]|uniref:hypothetical protein n=1 Tax=Dactylosporangium sp. CA-092794 TaxID=3239929 RepID=UPI003D8A7783